MVRLYSTNFMYTGSSYDLVAVVVVVEVRGGSVQLLHYIIVGFNVLCAVLDVTSSRTVVNAVTHVVVVVVVVEVVIVRVCLVQSAERVTMCVCGARETTNWKAVVAVFVVVVVVVVSVLILVAMVAVQINFTSYIQ